MELQGRSFAVRGLNGGVAPVMTLFILLLDAGNGVVGDWW